MDSSSIFSKSAKLFFSIFFGLLFLSILALFYKYMTLHDYEIYLPEEGAMSEGGDDLDTDI